MSVQYDLAIDLARLCGLSQGLEGCHKQIVGGLVNVFAQEVEPSRSIRHQWV